MSNLDRFEAKVSRCPISGCHLWTAAVDQRGYGRFGFRPHGEKNYRAVAASRVAWELYVGPVPKGMEVCHHCENPACVNPEHLFLGTHKDNMNDRDRKGRTIAGQSNKTHCPRGHEYAGENVYIHMGSRKCKACNAIRQVEYRERISQKGQQQ